MLISISIIVCIAASNKTMVFKTAATKLQENVTARPPSIQSKITCLLNFKLCQLVARVAAKFIDH